MKTLFRCEYCGRRIKTEECPYCGGINTLPLDHTQTAPVVTEPKTAVPFVPKKLNPYQKFVTFMRVHTIIRTVCIFFICMAVLIFSAYLFFLANEEDLPSTVRTNRILDMGLDYTFSATVFDKTMEITLPCTVGTLCNKMEIKVPSVKDVDLEDRNKDGVLDFAPYQGAILRDANNIFTFSVVNDSYNIVPYTQASCDNIILMSYNYKDKLTSLKIMGTELLTDMYTVLDAFGEPTSYTTAEDFSKIEYKTPYGYLALEYFKSEDYAFPRGIYLSNLVQERINY